MRFALRDPLNTSTAEDQPGEIRGVLKFADAFRASNDIGLADSTGKEYIISVPEGMMADIVRPVWEDEVIVSCDWREGKAFLRDIRPAE
jgi:hypothetical protein